MSLMQTVQSCLIQATTMAYVMVATASAATITHREAKLAVSPDGRYIAMPTDTGNGITVWNLKDGTEYRKLFGPADESFASLAFSNDGQKLVAGFRDGFRVWDLTQGEEIYRVPGFAKRDCVRFAREAKSLIFIPTNGTQGGAVTEWGLAERRVLRTFDLSYCDSPPVVTNDEMRLFIIGGKAISDPWVIRCWDLTSNKHIGDVPIDIRRGNIQCLGLHASNDIVVASFLASDYYGAPSYKTDGLLVAWDVKRRTELRRFTFPISERVHKSRGLFISPTIDPKNNTLFAGWVCVDADGEYLENNLALQWDLQTGEVRGATIIPSDPNYTQENDVAIIPRTSTVATLAGAGNAVPYNATLTPIVRCDRDMLSKIISGKKRPESSVTLQSGDKNRTWGAFITDSRIGHVSPVAVNSHFRLRNYVGGGTLDSSEVRSDPEALRLRLSELITPSKNASNSQIVDRSKPRLFVLAVGITNYEFEEYNLAYASRDAKSLADRFIAENGRSFGDVQVQKYLDKDATVSSLNDGLAWLARSCTPNDVAIVFFSGHALRGRKGLYYFTYNGDEEGIQNTCLNWSVVAEHFAKTNAKQIFFLSDCCHAGAFAADRHVTQADLYKELSATKNLTVLASSDEGEKSLELKEKQHGAFTAALLEGLDGKCDDNADGKMSWAEIRAYTMKRVPELTSGRQHPKELKAATAPETLFLSSIGRADDTPKKPATVPSPVQPTRIEPK